MENLLILMNKLNIKSGLVVATLAVIWFFISPLPILYASTTGTITVIKTVVNDDGGTKTPSDFSFFVNDGAPIVFNSNGQNQITLPPGTYNVTEVTTSGYSVSYNNCSNIQLSSDDNKFCFITNSDVTSINRPPTLSGLEQWDGSTSLSEGWILPSPQATSRAISFSADVSDRDGDQVQLQVELRRFEEMFTGIDNGGILTSNLVPSGSENVRVTRSGLSEGKYHWRARTIDLNNNKSEWQEFGVTGNVDFEIRTKVPVIIVPGIPGSELYRDYDFHTKIWPPFIDDIQLPLELPLAENGTENPLFPMRVGDIIRAHDDNDYYKSLITELENNGYREGDTLFVFPYDWRLNITTNALLLKQKIDDVRQNGKVDIIAHSMGGLVSKLYIRGFPGTVRAFIDLATPHLGSPKAFEALQWGDDMGYGWLGEIVSKSLVQNMPSAYQLLPSPMYVQLFGPYFNKGGGHDGWLDYQQSMTFLVNSGRNPLAQTWSSLHDAIDNWNGTDYGVERIINIVGCGLATPASIYQLSGDHKYLLDYKNGDEEVPLGSAEALNSTQIYYAKNAVHGTLPSKDGVRQLIANLVSGNGEPLLLGTNLSTNRNSCGLLQGWIASVHSPIELHIYDSEGRHTGPKQDGSIENNIPGVAYDVIDDNKFAFLPDGGAYKITGKATGLGSFDARVERVENEQVTETFYYNEIPLTTLGTNVELTIVPNQTDHVFLIDQDGDSTFESEARPSSVLNTEESSDITAPITTSTLAGPKLNTGIWYVGTTTVSLTAEDDNSGVLKTEYSFDGGQTWNIYSNPFPVTQEGTTSVAYFSIDRAGNYEQIKNVEIKVDKMPPEAKIYFDVKSQQLQVEGSDNLSLVMITSNNAGEYLLTDEAGHTLLLTFKTGYEVGNRMKAQLYRIQYDNQPVVVLPDTNLQYEWSLDREGSVKELLQRISVRGAFDVQTKYNYAKDVTYFTVQNGSLSPQKSVQGMSILRLLTNSSSLILDRGY